MQHTIRLTLLAAVATLVFNGAAQAQAQAQDSTSRSTLKAGVIFYQTHSRTNGVTGIGIPPGADATVGNATTLLMTYEYALSPNFGVELVLGVPPKITARASGRSRGG